MSHDIKATTMKAMAMLLNAQATCTIERLDAQATHAIARLAATDHPKPRA
jgi:hypothetical protein